MDRLVQTDDWCVIDKWSQAPPEGFIECDSSKPGASLVPSLPTLPRLKQQASTVQLDKFLRKSSQVII